MKKVELHQDANHLWYTIPKEKAKEFLDDIDQIFEEYINDADFDDRWSRYRTGGSPNLVQLYIE